ncbi:MAG: hypothetical protein ACOCV8_00345 [Spirochaetota bacterium]
MKTYISKKYLFFIFTLIILLILSITLMSCAQYNTIEEANDLLMENKLEEAKQKYKEVLDKVEDKAPIEYNLAQIDYIENNYTEAVKEFETLAASQSKSVRKKALFHLGNLLMKQADMTAINNPNNAYGIYTDSIERYRQALKLEKELNNINIENEDALSEDTLNDEELSKNSLLKEIYNNLERAIRKRESLILEESMGGGDSNSTSEDKQKMSSENENTNSNSDSKPGDEEKEQNNSNQKEQQEQKESQNINKSTDKQDPSENQENKKDENKKKAKESAGEVLSAEEARKLLEEMRNKNEELQEELRMFRYQGEENTVDKDW